MGGRTLTGEGELLVTVRRWNDPPIDTETLEKIGRIEIPGGADQALASLRVIEQQARQCAMITGRVIDRRMVRVAPPSIHSRRREWP